MIPCSCLFHFFHYLSPCFLSFGLLHLDEKGTQLHSLSVHSLKFLHKTKHYEWEIILKIKGGGGWDGVGGSSKKSVKAGVKNVISDKKNCQHGK